MNERKWRMRRIDSGDYFLPSNDLRTFWRIQRYDEDGSAFFRYADGREIPIRGTFWQVYCWNAPGSPSTVEDFVDWDGWACVSHMHKTRKDAIDYALHDAKPFRA